MGDGFAETYVVDFILGRWESLEDPKKGSDYITFAF